MIAAGHPHAQAVAAALSNADRAHRARGGGIAGFAAGGSPSWGSILAGAGASATPQNSTTAGTVFPGLGYNVGNWGAALQPLQGFTGGNWDMAGSSPFAQPSTFNPTGYGANSGLVIPPTPGVGGVQSAITDQSQAAAAIAAQQAMASPTATNPAATSNNASEIVAQAPPEDGGGGARRGGAVRHYQDGGIMPNGMPTAPGTANPVAQSQIQRYQSMSPEQLQQLTLVLGSTPQGQLASRVLQQKRIMPNVGQPQAQQQPQQGAIASINPAAMSQQQQPMPQQARGGNVHGVRHYDDGGTVGYLHGQTPGRTDVLHVSPPGGSYVIPADVMAGLGDGNNLSGAAILGKAFGVGPWGTPVGQSHRGAGVGLPKPPPRFTAPLEGPSALPEKERRGGSPKEKGVGVPTPILAAAGEYIVHPAIVRQIGGGDITRGHNILDAWVMKKRKDTIDKMQKLQPPKKG